MALSDLFGVGPIEDPYDPADYAPEQCESCGKRVPAHEIEDGVCARCNVEAARALACERRCVLCREWLPPSAYEGTGDPDCCQRCTAIADAEAAAVEMRLGEASASEERGELRIRERKAALERTARRED